MRQLAKQASGANGETIHRQRCANSWAPERLTARVARRRLRIRQAMSRRAGRMSANGRRVRGAGQLAREFAWKWPMRREFAWKRPKRSSTSFAAGPFLRMKPLAPGLHSFVHVLIEVEGGQDQNRVRLRAPYVHIARRRRIPTNLRATS